MADHKKREMKEGMTGLTDRLKMARIQKRLSQRALGQKIGLPQSHISKIESGQVDPRASSLIELARTLSLEIMLVPQNLVAAVEALSRSSTLEPGKPRAMPAYRLTDGDDDA